MIADPHRTYPCRCRKCGKRKRLAADKVDTHVCEKRGCGGDMRIDRYRDSLENGPHNKCECLNYWFPHVRGRGWCEHNDKLTAEDMQRRHEEGVWQRRK